MKNKIDFQNDDIFEIEQIIDNMNLPTDTISGVTEFGHEWKSTIDVYVNGTISRIQDLEYELEQVLYCEDNDEELTYDDLDSDDKEFYNSTVTEVELERKNLEETLTKL